MSKKHKQYLGDAVYADWDGGHVILTTGDGVYESDRICLNDQVMAQLNNYFKRKQHGAQKNKSSDPT